MYNINLIYNTQNKLTTTMIEFKTPKYNSKPSKLYNDNNINENVRDSLKIVNIPRAVTFSLKI